MVDRRVLATARAVLGQLGRSSKTVGRASGGQVERMSVALVRRTVSRAASQPAAIDDQRALQDALAQERTSVGLSASSVTLVAGRLMRRMRPLRRFASKTPAMAAITAVPELYSSIADGLDDLSALASFLVRRAEREGAEVDPDRLRRAVVQLLDGATVDPAVEPEHDRLVWSWIGRSLRRSLPFGSRAGRVDAKRLAARAASVDVRTLRAPAPARG